MVKSFSAVCEARGGGESGSRTDHNGIGVFYLVLQALQVFFPAARIVRNAAAKPTHKGNALLKRLGIIWFLFIGKDAHKFPCPYH